MALTSRSVVALAAFALLACSGQDLTTPGEPPDDLGPSFAKKETVKAPVIKEYWVIPGETEDAPDMIHLVVSDVVRTVRATVAYDYFHNGLRDDDPPDGQHYEVSGMALPGGEVEDLGDGWAHLDILWDGTIDYSDPDAKWPNHLSIEIPGEGDPYVFILSLFDAKGDILDRVAPRGIVVGGVESDPPAIEGVASGMGLPEETLVRSYATFEGSLPAGEMYLSGLTLTNLQCQKTQEVSGKGKDRVVETVFRLSGLVSVAVERPSTPPDPDEWHVWWEGHFRDTETGDLSSRVAASNTGTLDLTMSMPTTWNGSGKIEFVVDFLSGIGVTGDIVYDPWANAEELSTSAGFGGPPWTTSRTGLTDGMAFPVAHSESVSVDCG